MTQFWPTSRRYPFTVPSLHPLTLPPGKRLQGWGQVPRQESSLRLKLYQQAGATTGGLEPSLWGRADLAHSVYLTMIGGISVETIGLCHSWKKGGEPPRLPRKPLILPVAGRVFSPHSSTVIEQGESPLAQRHACFTMDCG